MKTNQEFKNEALQALKGNWAPAVACTVVLFLIMCVILGPSYTSYMSAFGMMHIPAGLSKAFTTLGLPISIFLYYPLLLGYCIAFFKLHSEGDTDITANLFRSAFTGGYLHNVWGLLLMNIFIFLWSLLLLIPGIIKAFSYAMTPFILKDYPELSANQAIDLSRKMMKGHKFDLFWLNLSFIGWFFLCLVTMGIGFVWFLPYVQTANSAFYQNVKKELMETKLP